MDSVTAYKVFTHDLRPPIQPGGPVWGGVLPYVLPVRPVDKSEKECGEGWNACRDAHVALRIAGLWSDGRPSRLFRVRQNGSPVLTRGDKMRSATWIIEEEIMDLTPAIRELSKPFGEHADEMVREQLVWREALARPQRKPGHVRKALRAALEKRDLTWRLRRFDSAWAAWDARLAWTALDAWTARDARLAWTARTAWDARLAWAAWDARIAWTAWAAWDAWTARDALAVWYTALSGRLDIPQDYLTVGIRDAYRNGLAVALPTGPDELGWAMKE